MSDLRFWIPVLGIPILAFFANIVVRVIQRLPQSALPDIILCFVVFDALVAIQNEEFSRFVRMSALRDATIAVYVALLFLNLIIWFVSVSSLEPSSSPCMSNTERNLTDTVSGSSSFPGYLPSWLSF